MKSICGIIIRWFTIIFVSLKRSFCISYEETQNKRLIYEPIKLNL